MFIRVMLISLFCLSGCSVYKLPNESYPASVCIHKNIRQKIFSIPENRIMPGQVSGSLDLNYPGSHEELGMEKKGILFSKKYHWQTDVAYFVELLVETDEHVLLLSGPHIKQIRPPGPEWLLQINKVSGEIIQTIRLKGNLGRSLYEDGYFHYQTRRDMGEIYCLKI